LVIEWLVDKELNKEVYDVPPEIDNLIARYKLESMGFGIDKLSKEQEKYLESWVEGTG
jgi:adenosylhomocysteinase